MAASKNLGVDAGLTAGGDWLYKQGELVLGPVPGSQIIAKLFAGDLDGNSTVSPLGENLFRRVAEVDEFRVALARAEQHRKVDAAARAEQARVTRARNIKLALVGTVALVVAVGAAAGARWFAVHNPLKADSDELAFGDITVEPPTIALARARTRGDEELIDYPAGGGSSAPARPSSAAASRPSGPTAARTGGGGRMSDPTADPDGMQTAQFDQGAINAVVASNQRSLFVCFREEAARNPSFAAKIPLEFVIGNNGRVTKLWVDHPSYKQGAMADCLLRELQKWSFKPYEGENATVSLSFNIGKRG
jgi:hypothetical protein